MRSSLVSFKQHLCNRPGGISPYTVNGYLADLLQFAAWFKQTNSEPARMINVTPVDVRDYKAYLQTVKKFKPATINRHLASMRSYFSWATSKGFIQDHPVQVKNVDELGTAPLPRRADLL